ncbi:uncharacterized protein LOC112494634 [Cephus cinctus]|uniref:Uncharacterized protein LOC112494634 n=1 Tax=Cephus cinctus TaxID=211228 RepID=A0AAJ7RKS5_CEPCN|nr:uncharacterized protein LOC112494634 [Cephus cinctus]
MILRPIIMYAHPVWCSAAPTNIKPLQIFQNKCLRLILSKDRYARISDMHDETALPKILEYAKELGERFYREQLNNNELTTEIAYKDVILLDLFFHHSLRYLGHCPVVNVGVFYSAWILLETNRILERHEVLYIGNFLATAGLSRSQLHSLTLLQSILWRNIKFEQYIPLGIIKGYCFTFHHKFQLKMAPKNIKRPQRLTYLMWAKRSHRGRQ